MKGEREDDADDDDNNYQGRRFAVAKVFRGREPHNQMQNYDFGSVLGWVLLSFSSTVHPDHYYWLWMGHAPVVSCRVSAKEDHP